MPLYVSSELDAVNILLGTILLSPVNSLSGVQTADVSDARKTLQETSREVQSTGWYFNTRRDVTLTPSGGGITVGNDVLSVDLPRYTNKRVHLLGRRLFNKDENDYSFDSPITDAIVKVLLDFEDLPEAFRYYVTIRASRKYQQRRVGDGGLDQLSADDEVRAKAACDNEESEQADYNFLPTFSSSGRRTPVR